jgi:hypothetical protein
LARWRTGIRTRVLDAWWLVREGPRAAFRRPPLGPTLAILLISLLVAGILVELLGGHAPHTSMPAGIPTRVIGIVNQQEEPADSRVSFTLPTANPPTDESGRGEESRADRNAAGDGQQERRDPPDRSPSSEGGTTAPPPSTAPADTDTGPVPNDASPQPEPSPTDAADSGGGSGPGGGGPDTGGGDSGDDGGGGGGGGGG